ncbi:MAG TPA: ATP-binding protein, partial [Patescibacteria group bacterium]
MVSRTYSATMVGLNPVGIEVEVDLNRGAPNLVIIGLPTKAVDESKERITGSITSCGIRIRHKRTIVNLAPADIKKTSSVLDFAIAIGILKAYGEITIKTNEILFLGELSLDGYLKPIKGALPLVMAAKEMGYQQVVLPQGNQEEVAVIGGITIHPIRHLKEFLDFAQQATPLTRLQPITFSPPEQNKYALDFADVIGQEEAKRALEIAAAGGHNILLSGPPGAGKSMMARCLASILPPMIEEEALEVTKIYSVSGLINQGLITTRPFRAPHHTTSQVGLIGGGTHLQPGEISLAH